MSAKAEKREITKELIEKAIAESKPNSLTQLSKAMGFRGSISGNLAKKIKALVPDISDQLKRNVEGSETGKAEEGVKKVKKGIYPRHDKNPFRDGSSYAQIFDAFVSHRDGLRRDELLKVAAAVTGKDAKHAAYDLAVILSPKESPTGPRHRSCREGYWVKRENDHVTIMLD